MRVDQLAASFARAAHEGINQKRRYDQSPYFDHSARVAEIVRATGASLEVVAAAYLHDVVEDVPLENLMRLAHEYDATMAFQSTWRENDPDSRANKLVIIEALFGGQVATLVEQVTNLTKPGDGDRAFRRQTEVEHLSKASSDAQTIKLADLIDNSRDIKKCDAAFAMVYLKDKADLLKTMNKGHSGLLEKALIDC